MRATSIHFLLISSLLGCPLFCGTGSGGSPEDACGESRQAPQCCAACHVQAPVSPQTDPASPCDHNSGTHSCQCICGGAILVDAAQLDHPLLGLPMWIGADCDPAAAWAATLDGSPDADFFLTQRDVGATPGRLLRCLYASLLC